MHPLDAGKKIPEYHSMTMTAQLIRDIETFLVRTGMAPSMFGEKACGDKHVVRRLRAGRSVTLRRADQIREFMTSHEGNGRRRGSATTSAAA